MSHCLKITDNIIYRGSSAGWAQISHLIYSTHDEQAYMYTLLPEQQDTTPLLYVIVIYNV